LFSLSIFPLNLLISSSLHFFTNIHSSLILIALVNLVANFLVCNIIALKCFKPVATYLHVKSSGFHVDFTDFIVAILDSLTKDFSLACFVWVIQHCRLFPWSFETPGLLASHQFLFFDFVASFFVVLFQSL